MTTKLEDAQESRQIAEHQLATVRAEVESKALERTRQLIEAPQPVIVPWNEYPAYDSFGQWPTAYDRPFPYTNIDDRTEGRYRPYYETAQDLRRIRADARRLKAIFPVAAGALESLTNHVIGTGFEYSAQPNRPDGKELASMVQKVVDRLLDRNDFVGTMDREIHVNSREDGEQFVFLYPDENDVRIELTDPDFILEPADPKPIERMARTSHKINGWWHGVHTTYDLRLRRDDVTRPIGYHAVFDRSGDDWDYLPACRVEHLKRNVGRMGRRGVSDFLLVQRDLEAEGKIRRNTAEGAAILAAIVMIRQHAEGVPRSTIESMVSNSSTANYEKRTQDGQRTTYVEQTRPGTIKDTPAGMTTTLGALGTLRSPVYIEVAQYLLRIIGDRWNMPEYLISGDASNANFASTLVSESPFVRAREQDQAWYASHFERIIWKALRMYHEAGAFGGVSWQVIRSLVSLKVDYQSPASRDKLAQAQVNQILNENKVMSKRTWATDSGLDYDEEQTELATEPKPTPQPAPFGQVGFGQPQPFGTNAFPPRTEARTNALAIRAIDRLLENHSTLLREDEEKWVTINGSHVKINDDGTVAPEIASLKGGKGSKGEKSASVSKGEEHGAKAVFKGDKYRVVSKGARLNIDQAADLMGERGYKIGKPEYNLRTKQTEVPIEKNGKRLLVPAKAILKFLTTENPDIQ